MDRYRSDAVLRELKAEMARQGKTKTALADHLGAHRQTVQRKFAGNPHFNLDELAVIAYWLGTTVTDLISRTEAAA